MKEKTTPPPVAKRNLTPEQHTICQAKSLGVAGKHAGSKPIRRLKKSIARVNDDNQKQRFAANIDVLFNADGTNKMWNIK